MNAIYCFIFFLLLLLCSPHLRLAKTYINHLKSQISQYASQLQRQKSSFYCNDPLHRNAESISQLSCPNKVFNNTQSKARTPFSECLASTSNFSNHLQGESLGNDKCCTDKEKILEHLYDLPPPPPYPGTC